MGKSFSGQPFSILEQIVRERKSSLGREIIYFSDAEKGNVRIPAFPVFPGVTLKSDGDSGHTAKGASSSYPYITWYWDWSKKLPYAYQEKGEKEYTQIEAMLTRLGVSAVKIFTSADIASTQEKVLYGARFKVCNATAIEEDVAFTKLPEKMKALSGKLIGFVDFLIGSPDAMESLIMAGELCGSMERIQTGGELTPPDPERWTEAGDHNPPSLITLTYRVVGLNERALIMERTGRYETGAKGVTLVEQQDTDPFYKCRYYLSREDAYPTPGEFICLAGRALRGRFFRWFGQETNPFAFSGNWFETTFYTSGLVEEVVDASEGIYKVRCKDTVLTVETSDYKEYQVGQRVCIGKDFGSNEKFMTYDMLTDDNSGWKILPLTFYQ